MSDRLAGLIAGDLLLQTTDKLFYSYQGNCHNRANLAFGVPLMNHTFIQLLEKSVPLDFGTACWAHSSYALPKYQKQLFSAYQIDFPTQLKQAVPKRCAEFLAGRYVAQQAVKELTTRVHQIPVANDRSPIWPEGIVGSISHTDSQSIAAVAFKEDCQLLGLDLENWIEPDLALELSSQIIDSTEIDLLSETELSFHQGLTLIFSAKESLYKALYPKVQTFFGFESARITNIDQGKRQFTVSLIQALTKEYCRGWQVTGCYFSTEDTVLTIIYD
ncbi:4'-phosphopantetheinyl transferase superfamily protein [Vibrio profundum]|uniref:4'-phosphopantetheinyl transferase family protein n=1 Tax=Vibrio profundum TaxID=2910247 RepID=UPI003D13F6A3